MITHIEQVANSALKVLRDFTGVNILYNRGSLQCSVRAIQGKSELETMGVSGVFETRFSVDFIIASSEIVLDSEVVAPSPGDIIIRSLGSLTTRFEVISIGGEPCYRFIDTAQQWVRVHTKRVT